MPDRAVVACRRCNDTQEIWYADDKKQKLPCPDCTDHYARWIARERREAVEEYKASQPRALVALSEDRQWLVTPDPAGHPLWFVFHWEETATDVGWMVQDKMIEAAGQDAHAVLARWLEGRGG